MDLPNNATLASKPAVIVLTDHQATAGIVHQSSLFTQDVTNMNPRMMSASAYLAQYRLDVRHIPGKLNLVPDALSRLPTSTPPEDAGDGNKLDDI